ncbi:MAG: winged helix DNA-binding domain-containing protein [Actinomycetota bacterium]|nr:winged helix DNA-binding domain-containing protein [Actinomycetota bacterium]
MKTKSAVKATRAQVIAYRVASQGLHRDTATAGKLGVLDIGVQDSSVDGARLAFDARLAKPLPASSIGPGKPLALTWSLRGAPYVHRRADLNQLAAALWPLSEPDAAGRLNETGPSVARAGIPALEQWAVAVEAMHEVVTKPMGKGAASTAVTRRIPRQMWRDCRGCKAMHISDSAMRPAALTAGLEIEPGSSPPVLLPRPRAVVPAGVDVAGVLKLIKAYLTLLGPAAPGDAAGYLDARRADVQDIWPSDLVEVTVDGRTGWLPADRVAALEKAQPADLVRLLGPFDPYVQARDRELIVPDKALHKTLWPVLGRPGILLVGGEVLGIWRPKAAGVKLTVAVEAFAPLPASAWTQIEAEAERVGAVRGARDIRLTRAG